MNRAKVFINIAIFKTLVRSHTVATITLASWNVNSLKVRLPQLLDWLTNSAVDAIVLQETKLTDDQFPVDAIQEAGFDVVFTGQKTYNGVALLTRRATMATPTNVDLNLPGFPDEQKRLVAATLTQLETNETLRFVGGYFPNGMTPGSWKYLYKLDWLRALRTYLQMSLKAYPRLVLGGDFNIAPTDLDVWNPESWKDGILVSAPERQAFQDLLALGFTDSYRHCHPNEPGYSWGDYRMKGFEKNHGLRIDHLLVSDTLVPSLVEANIQTELRGLAQPSDHAPVVVQFNF